MARYKAILDNAAKVITVIVSVGVIIPLITIVRIAIGEGMLLMLLVPVVVVALFIVAFMLSPQGYEVENGTLRILRRYQPVEIPLAHIIQAVPVTKKELGFGFRAFGVGGFMGYFGLYRYAEAGKVNVYVTDMNSRILLTLADGKKVLVSPEETGGFMRDLQQQLRRMK